MPETASIPALDPAPRYADAEPYDLIARRRGPVLEATVALDAATAAIRLKGFSAGAFEAIAGSAGALHRLFGPAETAEEAYCLKELGRTDSPEAAKLRDTYRGVRRTLDALSGLVRGMERGRITGSSAGDLLRASTEAVTLVAACVRRESDVLCPYDRERVARSQVEH